MHHFYRQINIASRYQPKSSPSVLRWLKVLRKLQAHDDSGVLDEASEFMASNMSGYFKLQTHITIHDNWVLKPAFWGKDNHGESNLEFQIGQQSGALSGGLSTLFIREPVSHRSLPRNNLISRELTEEWLERDYWMNEQLRRRVNEPIRRRLVQSTRLAYLQMALSPYEVHSRNLSANYYLDRNEWSRNLLRRTIIASAEEHDEEAMYLSIDDIDKVSEAGLQVALSSVL